MNNDASDLLITAAGSLDHARCGHSNTFEPDVCKTLARIRIFLANLTFLIKTNAFSSFPISDLGFQDDYQILATIPWLPDAGSDVFFQF